MAKVKAERKLLDALNSEFVRGRDEDIFWKLGDGNIKDVDSKKKNDTLKDRVSVLESELIEKNKVIDSLRKQGEELSRIIEEKERKLHEAQILIKTMEANLHQLEGERRQYLERIEESGKEIANFQDKYSQAEEDIKNLTGQLKVRTQENILLNKENRDLQRTSNQLQETIALQEEKIRELNRELQSIEPLRAETEKKYNRALESLRTEVKAKHQEILRLSREVTDTKKAFQELQRVNENLELELDMLNTTNISLQKKIEKITLQNSILEKQLQNKFVRLVLAICSLFGWNPRRKAKDIEFS